MISLGLESIFVSDVLDRDWVAVGRGVAEVSLLDLDFSVLDSSVLHKSLFVSADAISGLESVVV